MESFFDKDINQFFNKNVKIIINNIIICAGIVKFRKLAKDSERCCFISIDNHYFFNVNSNSIRIEINEENVKIPFNISSIKNNSLKYSLWKDVTAFNFNEYDVVEDYDYSHIDAEVRSLCDAINNNFKGIQTTASCSGHNKRPAWIHIIISDIKDFQNLLIFTGLEKIKKDVYIINNLMLTEYSSSSAYLQLADYSLSNALDDRMFESYPALFIVTYDIGDLAYKAFNRLANYIDQFYKEEIYKIQNL